MSGRADGSMAADPNPPDERAAGDAPAQPNADVFTAYVAGWRDAINRALLGGVLAEPDGDLRRYLYRPALDFLARGGKRIRPALLVMTAEATGASPEAPGVLAAAASLEHFQSAALIHDDIADEAVERRGFPAVHIAEGVGVAINVGDLELVESFRGLVEAPGVAPAIRERLFAELSQMMVRTVEGQALDLGWARDGRWDVSPEDYLRMATLKTAHYSVATPLAMGAVIAGAPEELVEGLREAGIAAGLAFQIADDLLDLEGSAETLGKRPLGDLTEGKRTLAVTGALAAFDEEGREDERHELEELLSAHTTDPARLARAKELIQAGGGIERARRVAERCASEATALLNRLSLQDNDAAWALRAMPDYVLRRKS